jgi:hypothetical protein
LTLEERQQPYLLRLRQTKNVQRLVARQFARDDWSRPDNQGCRMVQAQLQLHGWSTKRRVVIVRQRIRGGIARERRVDGKPWEYAVLVTDVAYPLESVAQLYRDRADAENAFDELKNRWGRARPQTVRWTFCAWQGAGPVRWSATGGVGTAGLNIRRADWKPSPAARCCRRRWARPPATPTRRRCT